MSESDEAKRERFSAPHFAGAALRVLLGFILAFILFAGGCPAQAKGGGQSFPQWLTDLRAEAVREGITKKTLDIAFGGLKPDPKVLELDRRQPEKTVSFTRYRKNVVTPGRIREGRAMLKKHAALLSRVEERYGVPPRYVVALWGVETSFGKNTGGFDVIRSLATLAWEGRRGAFFRKELLDALKILDAGHIPAARMRGSWAGAMGQSQFMPSSFHKFAVDFNGDGRQDIWGTQGDVFASTANYLMRSGWEADWRWGRKVSLPKGCCAQDIEKRTRRTLAQWKKKGLTFADGGRIPADSDNTAWLAAPDGPKEEVWLVYGNYDALMRWNRSTYFATSVGLLADAIAGENPS